MGVPAKMAAAAEFSTPFTVESSQAGVREVDPMFKIYAIGTRGTGGTVQVGGGMPHHNRSLAIDS